MDEWMNMCMLHIKCNKNAEHVSLVKSWITLIIGGYLSIARQMKRHLFNLLSSLSTATHISSVSSGTQITPPFIIISVEWVMSGELQVTSWSFFLLMFGNPFVRTLSFTSLKFSCAEVAVTDRHRNCFGFPNLDGQWVITNLYWTWPGKRNSSLYQFP